MNSLTDVLLQPLVPFRGFHDNTLNLWVKTLKIPKVA